MIVVCGTLESGAGRDGLAVSIARRCAAAGAAVQVIGIVADGPAGDSRLLALASAGVGHAAVLRSSPRPLEKADVELALRYLPDVRVVIAADVDPALIAVIADGASFAGAPFILVGDAGAIAAEAELSPSAIAIEAPTIDPDETFAGFVGTFAARLDAGAVPADAWASTLRDLAVDELSRAPGPRGRAAAR